MDVTKEGTGGVGVDEKDKCVPTVFHLEWSQDVQDLVCTEDNPKEPITNLDLEMVGFFLCWLIMGELAPCPHHKYVGLYCDNSPTVSWVLRMVTRLLKISTYVGPGSDTDTDGLGLILGLHYYEVSLLCSLLILVSQLYRYASAINSIMSAVTP